MVDEIPIGAAAMLNGDSAGTYRALISREMRSIGKRPGRERMVRFVDVMLLRVVTEITGGNLNLKQAAARALALAPYIRDVATGKLGSDDREVFAVEFCGRVGPEEKRTGFICDGPENLADCVRKMAVRGWPNMRMLNLNRMMRETKVGWIVATEGAEKAKALAGIGRDDSDLARMADELVVGLIEEMQRRLKGSRRSEPPAANDDWRRWDQDAESAA
jgi:hypothetical protein